MASRASASLGRGAVLALMVAPAALSLAKPPPRDLRLSLTPIAASEQAPGGLRVVETLGPAAGPLVLRLDTLEPGLDRVRDRVTALTARDAQGPLGLSGPEEDGQTHLVWTAARPTVGRVEVSYVMPSALPLPKRRGPHVDLQSVGRGVSGAFKAFLLLPAGEYDARVHWDLAPGDKAVTSLGDGDVHAILSAKDLGEALFLAGPLHLTSEPPPARGLTLAVLGEGVRVTPAAAWFARVYDAERRDFRAPPGLAFRILVRSYEGGPVTSGHAVPGAFLYYVPRGEDLGSLDNRQTIAHEFVHGLANQLDDEPGQAGTWYTEGIADYFSLVLPYREKLYTPAEHSDILRRMVAAYYTNPLREEPNAAIDKLMWTGGVAWRAPYTRGMMYFADLDAKLKARRSSWSVLELVNAMSDRFRAGAPKTHATWAALLAARVGPWAVADWRAMMAGRLIVPASDAFGPCLARRPATAGVFDLGFRRPTGVRAGEVVEGVEPAGNAWRAGLRDGDVMAATIDINPVASEYASALSFPIRRGGRLLTIRYDPHRGRTPAYEWRSNRTSCERRPTRPAEIGRPSDRP